MDVDGVDHAVIRRGWRSATRASPPAPRAGSCGCSTPTGLTPQDRHAVVVGRRSDPWQAGWACFCWARDATVTYCHSKTVDLPCRRRDRGQSSSPESAGPQFIKGRDIKPGGGRHRRRIQPGQRGRPSTSRSAMETREPAHPGTRAGVGADDDRGSCWSRPSMRQPSRQQWSKASPLTTANRGLPMPRSARDVPRACRQPAARDWFVPWSRGLVCAVVGACWRRVVPPRWWPPGVPPGCRRLGACRLAVWRSPRRVGPWLSSRWLPGGWFTPAAGCLVGPWLWDDLPLRPVSGLSFASGCRTSRQLRR